MDHKYPRNASLRLDKAKSGLALSAAVPIGLTKDEFLKVADQSYDLIERLTGCPCLSGRIKFVAEEDFREVLEVTF